MRARGVGRSGARQALLGCASAAMALACPRAARGEVSELAQRVESAWRAEPQSVTRLPARFVYDGETVQVPLPSEVRGRGCTALAVIASRGSSFHARLVTDVRDALRDERDAPIASVAGVATLVHCGDEAPVSRAVVTSDAGRGAFEMVLARGVSPPTPLAVVLPERTGGLLPPAFDPGPPASLPRTARRAELAEQRVSREGGKVDGRAVLRADGEGAGLGEVVLDAGCHRLEVFALEGARAARGRNARGAHLAADIDAELRDGDEGLLARDRTEAPDARLETCVGEATSARLVFIGSEAGGNVVTTHGEWALPAHLPALWEAAATGRIAQALRARHVGELPDEAVALAQGSGGLTAVPLTVEQGACYLALGTVTHGASRGMVLRVQSPPAWREEGHAVADDAAVVAFCARDVDHVRALVEARGSGIAWGIALYRLRGGVWEAPR